MRFARLVRLAAPLLALAAGAGPAAAAVAPDAARYALILSRAPFGPPPPTAGRSAGDAALEDGPGSAGPAESAPPPPSPLLLRSLSRYDGRPAAGFEEAETKRTFLLREGESMGAYRLIEADVGLGAAVFAQGTNEFFVTLSYASGQATNFVPSARAPFLTAFRPERAASLSAADGGEPGSGEGAGAPVAGVPASVGGPAEEPDLDEQSIEITPEEDAELRRRATVRGPDGTEHLSYREYNRLRVRLREQKAAELRSRLLARWEERERAQADAARAQEEERAAAAARASEEAAAHRAAVVQALIMGYDVDVDFELSDEELAQLREAGFEEPATTYGDGR